MSSVSMGQTYKYAYTFREGGYWIKIESKTEPDFVKAALESDDFHHELKPAHPDVRTGHRHRVLIPMEIEGDTFTLSAAAIKFPDGRVWDAFNRGFRDGQ